MRFALIGVNGRGGRAFLGEGLILAAVVLHFVFAADVENAASSLTAEDRFVVLEAIRQIGVAIYLFAITLGLATIVHVVRFESVRIRELAAEAVGA